MSQFVFAYRISLALLALTLAPLFAAEIIVEQNRKVNVEVAAFAGADGELIRRVVSDDLRRTSLIEPSAVAPLIVNATYAGNTLQGKLFSRSSGKDLLQKTYTGDSRKIAHEFADDLTEALTGVTGFATSRIAFISTTTGNKELYTSDMDGVGIRRLTTDKSISTGPAWSPDGSTIAYMSYKSGYPDVYIVKLAQGIRTRIAGFPGINTGPAFSPDGKQIALTLSKDGNPEIYTMSSQGGLPNRITRTRGTETSPSWSPDGSRIVYNSDDRGSTQLYIVPASGGDPEKINLSGTYNSDPTWSPDGKKIAYTARAGGGFSVWVYDLEKRSAAQASPGSGEDPSWTRNSRHLVYSSGGALHVLDTLTKQAVRIENGLSACTEPNVTR